MISVNTELFLQIAQPQVSCTKSPREAIDKKSNVCRRVSKAAKYQLGISISGNEM